MRNILYIGDFADYFSTENYVTHAFEQNGCAVYKVQEADIQNAKVVLGACIKYHIDLVLFSKGHFNESEETMELLRKHKITTAGWIYDLFFDLPRHFGTRSLTNCSFRADITFMTDGGHAKEFKNAGVNQKWLLQGIHEPDAKYGDPSPHPAIVFLGTYSYNERIRLIHQLQETYGKDFIHYGRGGMKRETRGMALNNILASCKIVVGDSMPSQHYWSNRIYEVTGRGGFIIHPYVDGLEKHFTEGVHFEGYPHADFEALKTKIDYYLTHDAEREKIRLAGHELTKTKYTYTARVRELLKQVDAYERKKS